MFKKIYGYIIDMGTGDRHYFLAKKKTQTMYVEFSRPENSKIEKNLWAYHCYSATLKKESPVCL